MTSRSAVLCHHGEWSRGRPSAFSIPALRLDALMAIDVALRGFIGNAPAGVWVAVRAAAWALAVSDCTDQQGLAPKCVDTLLSRWLRVIGPIPTAAELAAS